ncbi:hypothetical protein DN581_24490 [Burkholderia multivorans]|nr:hypothetical protein DN502_28920 [Burkholderia multivorans]RAB35470.1 hypothetical protein DN526_22650 [Burkholderia multivorans]RAB83770.1 hypothetical protein DN543_27140 [Burkholderia multivorans]RAE07535.1 hypothetical protein DN581_24490 [Burkholderia multivorans]RAE29796.1 hypothetical protein DN466_29350 [Burkholderia multivorans]
MEDFIVPLALDEGDELVMVEDGGSVDGGHGGCLDRADENPDDTPMLCLRRPFARDAARPISPGPERRLRHRFLMK